MKWPPVENIPFPAQWAMAGPEWESSSESAEVSRHDTPQRSRMIAQSMCIDVPPATRAPPRMDMLAVFLAFARSIPSAWSAVAIAVGPHPLPETVAFSYPSAGYGMA